MKGTAKIAVATLAPVLLLVIIAGVFWQTGFLFQTGVKPSGPLEKITIGGDSTGFNSLLWIAQSQGFDKEHGLELTIKTYQAGRDAMQALRSGELDLACCAEFVLVSEILAGPTNLRCVSVIASGEIDELIARRDKGISRPEDLRGKTIGVPLGTSAEFFLGRFLTFNQIALDQVKIVNINPFDLADALAAGKVDAVVAWEPITYDIINKIKPNTITWSVQEGQDFYWLLMAPEEILTKRPAVVENLLRALAQAANFMKDRPAEARAIRARWRNLPLADLQASKYPQRYELFLDQALLLAMEDEARWLMHRKLTGPTRLPDFLDYFRAEPLARVDPGAILMVLPRSGSSGGPAHSGKGPERR